MKRKLLLPLVGFVLVFLLHASYSILESTRLAGRWADLPGVNYLSMYFERGEYLLGASYALSIGLTIYAVLRFRDSRQGGAAGLIGGLTLTGVLYVAGCFLLGCCGSPMLGVYLTLFGSSFLGFTKPLTFLLTFTSVVIGYLWMERTSGPGADRCNSDGECRKN